VKLGKPSVVRRLAIWYIFSVFATALVGFAYIQWSLRHVIAAQYTASISDRLESVLETLKISDDPARALVKLVEYEWPTWRFEKMIVLVRGAGGKVIAQTPGLPKEFPARIFRKIPIIPVAPTQATSPGLLARTSPLASKPMVVQDELENNKPYLALAVESEMSVQGGKPAVPVDIFLALDVSHGQALIRHQELQIVLTLIALLILCTLIGSRVSAAAFEPVRRVIRAATHITSANLHERVPIEDLPEEIHVLASTVNEMLGRIEESFVRLSRFSSDLAHELRTPLNNLRGEIEVTLSKERPGGEYREALYSVLEEAQRLGRIIESLLFLAVVEAPDRQLRKEIIPLRAEVENLADFHSAQAADQETQVSIEIDRNVEVIAERTLFQRVISNLLSNAIRHSGGGRVLVTAKREKDLVIIEVKDTGCGIAAEDLPHVFDRFYRADASRYAGGHQGFGLGLTIVRTIVQLHRGEVSIQSAKGEGTSVTVTLPA